MSDMQIRSQEFAQRAQMAGAARSDAAQGEMVQGLRQSAGMGMQAWQQNRQMAQQQQQFDAELSMRHEESSLRNQMAMQEMAINSHKLQVIQAIDATDMGKAQLQLAQEQARAARIQNDEIERKAASMQRNEAASVFTEVARAVPWQVYVAKGIYPNPSTLTFDEMTPEQAEQARGMFDRSSSSSNPAVELKRQQNLVTGLTSTIQDLQENGAPQEQIEAATAMRDQAMKGLQDAMGVPTPSPSPKRRKEASSAMLQKIQSSRSPSQRVGAAASDTKVANFIVDNQAEIVAMAREGLARDTGREMKMSDDEILDYLITIYRDYPAGNPTRAALVQFLQQNGIDIL